MFTPPVERSRLVEQRGRSGLTLLEMMAVVALIGIFAALAATRFGHRSLGNVAARGFAHRLSVDLLQTQRRSIATGDNHFLEFYSSGSVVTGYRLRRETVGGPVDADSLREVPRDVVVGPSHSRCEYNFEGGAEGAYRVTVAGPDRRWQVEVTPATGAVRSLEQMVP